MYLIATLLALAAIIIFSERSKHSRTGQADGFPVVHTISGDSLKFLNIRDINKLISEGLKEEPEAYDTDKIEQILESNNLIRECQVSKNVQGDLILHIEENNPQARIFRPDGSGAYISDEGQLLSLSARFTARVLILSGKMTEKMLSQEFWRSAAGEDLLKLLDYIRKDDFLSRQVSELVIDNDFNIKMLPQVGNHVIIFGSMETYSDKFDRLTVFYNDILPKKGWNFYKEVDLTFSGQVVCR